MFYSKITTVYIFVRLKIKNYFNSFLLLSVQTSLCKVLMVVHYYTSPVYLIAFIYLLLSFSQCIVTGSPWHLCNYIFDKWNVNVSNWLNIIYSSHFLFGPVTVTGIQIRSVVTSTYFMPRNAYRVHLISKPFFK